jgi:hypothetical protein
VEHNCSSDSDTAQPSQPSPRSPRWGRRLARLLGGHLPAARPRERPGLLSASRADAAHRLGSSPSPPGFTFFFVHKAWKPGRGLGTTERSGSQLCASSLNTSGKGVAMHAANGIERCAGERFAAGRSTPRDHRRCPATSKYSLCRKAVEVGSPLMIAPRMCLVGRQEKTPYSCFGGSRVKL